MPCKFTGCCCWRIWRRRDDADEERVKKTKKDRGKVRYEAKAPEGVKAEREVSSVGVVDRVDVGKIKSELESVSDEVKVEKESLQTQEDDIAIEEGYFEVEGNDVVERKDDDDETGDMSPGICSICFSIVSINENLFIACKMYIFQFSAL